MTWLFALALGLASLVATHSGRRSYRRTALALTANWAGVLWLHVVTGTPDFWLGLVVVDALTAWVVLRRPASQPQAAIGFVSVIQIVLHLVYSTIGTGPATDTYLTMLAVGEWLQVGILAVGSGYGAKWLLGTRGRLGADHGAAAAGRARVGL